MAPREDPPFQLPDDFIPEPGYVLERSRYAQEWVHSENGAALGESRVNAMIERWRQRMKHDQNGKRPRKVKKLDTSNEQNAEQIATRKREHITQTQAALRRFSEEATSKTQAHIEDVDTRTTAYIKEVTGFMESSNKGVTEHDTEVMQVIKDATERLQQQFTLANQHLQLALESMQQQLQQGSLDHQHQLAQKVDNTIEQARIGITGFSKLTDRLVELLGTPCFLIHPREYQLQRHLMDQFNQCRSAMNSVLTALSPTKTHDDTYRTEAALQSTLIVTMLAKALTVQESRDDELGSEWFDQELDQAIKTAHHYAGNRDDRCKKLRAHLCEILELSVKSLELRPSDKMLAANTSEEVADIDMPEEQYVFGQRMRYARLFLHEYFAKNMKPIQACVPHSAPRQEAKGKSPAVRKRNAAKQKKKQIITTIRRIEDVINIFFRDLNVPEDKQADINSEINLLRSVMTGYAAKYDPDFESQIANIPGKQASDLKEEIDALFDRFQDDEDA